jgi:hypothetical protein
MADAVPEPELSEREAALGFSVQTLTYPEGRYELANLGGSSGSRLERTVALALDDLNRIRRRHGAAGYLHERFDGAVWQAIAPFDSADAVAVGDAYRQWADRRDDLPPAGVTGPDGVGPVGDDE